MQSTALGIGDKTTQLKKKTNGTRSGGTGL
jgi:hypothetical protein